VAFRSDARVLELVNGAQPPSNCESGELIAVSPAKLTDATYAGCSLAWSGSSECMNPLTWTLGGSGVMPTSCCQPRRWKGRRDRILLMVSAMSTAQTTQAQKRARSNFSEHLAWRGKNPE